MDGRRANRVRGSWTQGWPDAQWPGAGGQARGRQGMERVVGRRAGGRVQGGRLGIGQVAECGSGWLLGVVLATGCQAG